VKARTEARSSERESNGERHNFVTLCKGLWRGDKPVRGCKDPARGTSEATTQTARDEQSAISEEVCAIFVIGTMEDN